MSDGPRKHEFGKERVETEGNIHNKLYNACLKGQLSIIKDILKQHNTVLISDQDKQTPLYAACIGNHQEIVKVLIDFGYDVNHQDNEGKTPLHIVFENYIPDLANILMTQFKANTKIRDIHGWTPLHTAVDKGYYGYSKSLSQKFFHQDIGKEVSWIQLHAACILGNTYAVKVLLDAKTDVNHINSAGHAPLLIAVIKSNVDLVTLLLEQNVDVNCVKIDGQAPLHIAVENTDDVIIQKLLVQKADPSRKDALGNASLHLAVQLQKETRSRWLEADACDGSDKVNPSPASYRSCSMQTVQEIIKHGVDVNVVNSRCQTPLWFACYDGQEHLVHILLDKGADRNIAHKNGNSSLHAALHGFCSIEIIQALNSHGAHVNPVNNIGETPLVLACKTAQKESVSILLKAKADPNIANADGFTSLHAAIDASCSKETVQELIHNGATVNSIDKKGRTPLLIGCLKRQVELIEVLLGARADPAIADEESFSCLHAAVDGRCSTKTLQALIDHGARSHIDAKRKDGTNALLCACSARQSESVRCLLENGADVNISKPDGNTTLHVAISGNCNNETLEQIIHKGVAINAVNSNGETALQLTCYTSQMEFVRLLLEKNADLNISDVKDYTSLHAAVHGLAAVQGFGKNYILQEIIKHIKHKKYLDAQNVKGQTALFLACSFGQENSVLILLEAGSNPNITDEKNNTSLHAAVLGSCSKNIIKAIIDHGALVNATNNQSDTALTVSCRKGNADVINVLLKEGANPIITDADGKAFTIPDEEISEDKASDEWLIPSPLSVSRIAESTTTFSQSKTSPTDKSENYVSDNLSSLSDISSIKVSDGPRQHKFGKERVEREGNIHNKLYNACLKGQLCVVKDILKQYNHVLISDEDRQTPLYAACIGNHPEIVKLLIDFGYDVDHQDNEGKTPLHKVFENHIPDLALMLMTQFGANTEIRDLHGWTPLHTAIDKGYYSYSKELSEIFLRQDTGTEVSWIQLHGACVQGNMNNAQLLLDAKTDVNHVNSAGHTPLHIAVIKSNIDLISLLLNQHVDVNCVKIDGKTPLHIAVENTDETIIQDLLSWKADPSLKDALGNTSLHLAVKVKRDRSPVLFTARTCNNSDKMGPSPSPFRSCNKQTVHAIIENGVNVNVVNNRCQTPLWFACYDGQEQFVKILLDAGADPNIAAGNGYSCLHAALHGCCITEIVQALLSHGAHVNPVNNVHETPLLLACKTAQKESVKVLLEAKADPNIANADGFTSLHAAIDASCSKETVQELIHNGATVNSIDKRGRTPLLIGCLKRQVELIEVLLGARADPAIADEERFSCLHAAVDTRCSTNTLQALIDHGARSHIDVKRKDGTNALLCACRKGQSDSVRFLLKTGADVNIAKPDGNTTLHVAISGNCNNETLEQIIHKGVAINAVNSNGETALQLACYTSQMESVRLLLEKNADLNISDVKDYTSLHAAVHGLATFHDPCGYKILHEIIKNIKHKTYFDAQNVKGQTALFLACSFGLQKSVKILLEAGSNPNITDRKSNTSLHAAVLGSCSKNIIKAIIDRGALVNAKNKQKHTALTLSCRKGNVDEINFLLKNGPNPNITDVDDETVIHHAIYGGCSKKALKAIVDHGADINARSKSNLTPLMIACQKRNIDAIYVLLQAGADPNINDLKGATVIHHAVTSGCRKRILQAIIGHGADVNIMNTQNCTALMMACRKGDIDATNVLLTAGTNPNTVDECGDTCLHLAVRGGCNEETVQAIINHGIDVNAANKSNVTSLMIAYDEGNIDAINVLLQTGANPNMKDCEGTTALHCAAQAGCSKDTIQAVIDYGADVNAVNKDNVTALMIACEKGNIDVINVLLQTGADPNIKNCEGAAVLHYAAKGGCSKNGNVDAIHALLSVGAHHNLTDTFGLTCLHYAAVGCCNRETLQTIVDLSADVNARNKNDKTALMIACEKGNVVAIHELLQAGANPNIKDNKGKTATHYAAVSVCSKETLQALLNCGADITITDIQNRTALMIACIMGNEDAIIVLLTAGTNPNAVDSCSYTCLHFAVEGGCSIEAIHAIIDHGADVNATTIANVTALMFAIWKRSVSVINILLRAGANPNIANDDGCTCLHEAVIEYLSEEILQVLNNHGADVNTRDKKNQTALMLASEKGNTDAMNVLLKAGADPNIPDASGNTCFNYAIVRNCGKEMLQAMIDHSADVNVTNKKNQTVLSIACEQGNIDAINVLLYSGADSKVADADGDTCLHKAVNIRSNTVLQSLIDAGVDINATNKKNQSALVLACQKRNVIAINVLLKCGADRNIPDNKGNTLLHYAVHSCIMKRMLHSIIYHSADVNALNSESATALLIACKTGQMESVRMLLRAGAVTNTVDVHGNTCLHNVFHRECDQETLQMLLGCGVPVNATNNKHQTAYLLACKQGNVEAMRALAVKGADTSIVDDDGDTCLHYSVHGGYDKGLLQAIVHHGDHVNATNKTNQTALMAASKKGYIYGANVLLTAGADPNIADADGNTCL